MSAAHINSSQQPPPPSQHQQPPTHSMQQSPVPSSTHSASLQSQQHQHNSHPPLPASQPNTAPTLPPLHSANHTDTLTHSLTLPLCVFCLWLCCSSFDLSAPQQLLRCRLLLSRASRCIHPTQLASTASHSSTRRPAHSIHLPAPPQPLHSSTALPAPQLHSLQRSTARLHRLHVRRLYESRPHRSAQP